MSQVSGAADLVDSLDQALVGILPLAHVLEPCAVRSPEDVERSIASFAAAAQQLQAQLSRAQSTDRTSVQALQQEERQLREELAAKEALLQACTERLADWQARCERLAAKHRGASAL